MPQVLDEITMRALRRNPDERFATAREMALAIEAAIGIVPPAEIGAWTSRLAVDSLADRARAVAEIESSPGIATANATPLLEETATMQLAVVPMPDELDPTDTDPTTTFQRLPPTPDPMGSGVFSGLRFRSIGPAVTSGRVIAFAVDANDRSKYYVAVASGGVWKTVNAGTTWTPIFDTQGSYSIATVAIDPNDPLVVWVGTGENNSQRSVGYGDGVYKSTDGGRTWNNVGLKNSNHIGKILIDPRNSSVIYVSAIGPLWSAGGDRGVYKSSDGGKTWVQSLKGDDWTGAYDLAFDPRNPDVVFATTYQRARRQWGFIDGGPGSAIWKTIDGGANWTKLTRGIPNEELGKIGIAVSPVNGNIVYAIVEAANRAGGFFRSQDGGRQSYLLPDGTLLFLDPLLCRALDVVRQKQKAPSQERSDFLRAPQRHLREALSLDRDGDDEAADRLFIETRQFSERVSGIEIWSKPVLPWIRPKPNSWLPEAFGLRIGDPPDEHPAHARRDEEAPEPRPGPPLRADLEALRDEPDDRGGLRHGLGRRRGRRGDLPQHRAHAEVRRLPARRGRDGQGPRRGGRGGPSRPPPRRGPSSPPPSRCHSRRARAW